MNSRSIAFFGLLLSLVLPSCGLFEEADLTPPQPTSTVVVQLSPCDEGESIPLNQLPKAIKNFLKENYPNNGVNGIDIHAAANGLQSFLIDLEGGIQILFDEGGLIISFADTPGDFDEEDEVPFDELPDPLIDYLANNYPGVTISGAQYDNYFGTTFIKITIEGPEGETLFFTTEGEFLCVVGDDDDDEGDDDDDEGDEDDEGDDDDDEGDDDDDEGDDDDDEGDDDDDEGDDDDDEGDDDDDEGDDDDDEGDDDDDEGDDDGSNNGNNGNNGVPGLIVAYVSVNYQDYDIEEIEMEESCGGAVVYEVELEGPDPEPELYFDLDYNFLFEAYETTLDGLPTGVTTLLTDDYAGYTVDTDELEEHVYPDGNSQYRIKLRQGETEIELIVEEDGNVLCSDD